MPRTMVPTITPHKVMKGKGKGARPHGNTNGPAEQFSKARGRGAVTVNIPVKSPRQAGAWGKGEGWHMFTTHNNPHRLLGKGVGGGGRVRSHKNLTPHTGLPGNARGQVFKPNPTIQQWQCHKVGGRWG